MVPQVMQQRREQQKRLTWTQIRSVRKKLEGNVDELRGGRKKENKQKKNWKKRTLTPWPRIFYF